MPFSSPLPPVIPQSPLRKALYRGLEATLLLSNLYLLIAWLFNFDGNYQLMALWLWLAPWYLLHRGYWYFTHAREAAAMFNPDHPLNVLDPIDLLRNWTQKTRRMDWLTQEVVKKAAVGVMAFSGLTFFVQGNLYVLFDYTYRGQGQHKIYESCNYYTLLRPKKTNIGRLKSGYCDIFVLYRGKVVREPDLVPPYRSRINIPQPQPYYQGVDPNDIGKIKAPRRSPSYRKKKEDEAAKKTAPPPPKPALKDAYISKKSVTLANPYQEQKE